MKRLEIIANRAVEADLFDAFKKRGVVTNYTKIPIAYGMGNSEPKMGDHIWPEENVIIIVYCEEAEASQIRQAVAEVKGFFTQEGIKLFELG
ncbi:MAG: hypothetical protein JXB03_02275 [Spirochaetales bacterium]|nr:hypothetical protein [Spirochaetales bacterium]